MAQAQLLFTKESESYLRNYGFGDVKWQPLFKQIECILDDKHSFVVKRKRNKTVIILRKGTSRLTLNIEQFVSLCDLKESVQLLSSFLEGQL